MPAGRPLKFKSKEVLDNMIESYFMSIQDPDTGEYKRPPTVTGLAVFLGTSRETISNYAEKDEFFDSVKSAKDRCEQWVEENAMLGKANATFSIFNLKNNYGWEDKVTQRIEGSEENPLSIRNITDITATLYGNNQSDTSENTGDSGQDDTAGEGASLQ